MSERVITPAYLTHAQKHLDAIVADGSVTPELARLSILMQGINLGMMSRGQTGNYLDELRKELVSRENRGSPQSRADVSASLVIIDELLAHPTAHIFVALSDAFGEGLTVDGRER